MIVKELIEALEEQDPEATIMIAESQYDWRNVLVIIPDPSKPDDSTEVRVAD